MRRPSPARAVAPRAKGHSLREPQAAVARKRLVLTGADLGPIQCLDRPGWARDWGGLRVSNP